MDGGGSIEGLAALAALAGGVGVLLDVGFDPADAAEAAELVRRSESLARRVHALQVAVLHAIDAGGCTATTVTPRPR